MTKPETPSSNILVAAAWMVGVISSFSAMAIAGRSARTELDTFEVMLYRSLIGVVIVLLVAASTRQTSQIRPNRLGLHFLRNLSHFIGQNLWFFALPLIPLAKLIALEFSTPVWVLFLAALFLGEVLTRQRILVAVIGFVGVLVVANPEVGSLDAGTIAAALAALGFAGSAVMTKRLTRTEPILSIMFWLTVFQAGMGALMVLYDGQITLPSPALWGPVALVGLTGLSAHFCLTKALSLAPSVVVMPMDFLRLPTMTILGVLLYQESLEVSVVIGAALILGANAINLRKS
ncbi:DMT family transporter [Actibacterium mucosum]|uniref:DMT family transporter n=1 Tax=Actibacterium mucosum TaxID=1087332 RepID=UPI002E1C4E3F